MVKIMYIVCTYDVKEKSCVKVMKVLRRYLFHVQKSVFEGTLTPKQFTHLKTDLRKVTTEEDSILFYFTYNEKQLYKNELYNKETTLNILIDD